MKKLLLLLIIFYSGIAQAQNLVNNYSFEDTIACPYIATQIYYSTGWNQYGNGTPDYYNSCAPNGPGNYVSVPQNGYGFQYPATGNAYGGIFTFVSILPNYREYFGRQLVLPLTIGQNYYISFKANLANIDTTTVESCNCATNKLGILFTTSQYQYDCWNPTFRNFAHIHTNNIITDTLNWTTISGSFTADSAYAYIVIGNFFSDANTDTTILKGTKCVSYYYIDDICLSTEPFVCDTEIGLNESFLNNTVEVIPNPFSASALIKFNLHNINQNNDNWIKIYDIIGREVNNTSIVEKTEEIRIKRGNLQNGIYLLRIKLNNQIFNKKIIIN